MDCIFGPVPSRRLGRSLGVDLVPFKTCTYDCIYCQLGRTTHKTVERREWVPLDDVLAQLRERLNVSPDYITLSGSGEPTLYSRLDELIDRIRSLTDIPVAVLTNGSLLWQAEVRRQLMNAHLVIPSLDAGDNAMFNSVNRPDESICFENMLEGLSTFRKEYKGDYWLEVFFLAGYTAIKSEAEKIINCVRRIRPDRVQLNTSTRPTAENYACAVESQNLEKIAAWFVPPAEVIADYRGVHDHGGFRSGEQGILEMIKRRPCSINDIAQGLAMHRNEAIKYIEELSVKGLSETVISGGKVFYRGKPPLPDIGS
jgi:wyosine [tRNA(Phe)-imidazoG37] synthetase (radical SAM superfamily)